MSQVAILVLCSGFLIAIVRIWSTLLPHGTAVRFFNDRFLVLSYSASGLILVPVLLALDELSVRELKALGFLFISWLTGLIIILAVPRLLRSFVDRTK